MNQSCCWIYNQPYILFELKRSHRCLVCPSKARQGARKAAVTGKWRQNSWTKRFQGKPNGKNVENTIKNPIKLCLRRKNEVGSWFRGNRQTHTHRTTTVTLQRMRRELKRYACRRWTRCRSVVWMWVMGQNTMIIIAQCFVYYNRGWCVYLCVYLPGVAMMAGPGCW